MAYAVNLTGVELANHLADELSDLEFELLVRKRIKQVLARAHTIRPNLEERHDAVWFHYSKDDTSHWQVTLGDTYSKTGEGKGEVLTTTADDSLRIMLAKDGNKLSLLLAAPVSSNTASVVNGVGNQPPIEDRIPF